MSKTFKDNSEIRKEWNKLQCQIGSFAQSSTEPGKKSYLVEVDTFLENLIGLHMLTLDIVD